MGLHCVLESIFSVSMFKEQIQGLWEFFHIFKFSFIPNSLLAIFVYTWEMRVNSADGGILQCFEDYEDFKAGELNCQNSEFILGTGVNYNSKEQDWPEK